LIDDPRPRTNFFAGYLDRVGCKVTPYRTARDRRTVRGRIGYEVSEAIGLGSSSAYVKYPKQCIVRAEKRRSAASTRMTHPSFP
jgi:hypothetical protein